MPAHTLETKNAHFAHQSTHEIQPQISLSLAREVDLPWQQPAVRRLLARTARLRPLSARTLGAADARVLRRGAVAGAFAGWSGAYWRRVSIAGQ